MGNVVLSSDLGQEADQRLERLVAEILYIGSLMEYALFRQMEEEGLPEGAGKHML